jgi:DDE superfamily endonuclease
MSLLKNKLRCFLYTVSQPANNRNVQERFQHSGETVSRYFHQVLQAIHRLIPIYIKHPNPKITPNAIKHNSQFNSFFNDCIGAMDGTHIAAKVLDEVAPAFRNRKGYISQNVMATCDFDNLIFTYVLAGWEGSQHDGAVLESAFEHGFEIPAGKYYLGDAGYGLTPYCLTPY